MRTPNCWHCTRRDWLCQLCETAQFRVVQWGTGLGLPRLGIVIWRFGTDAVSRVFRPVCTLEGVLKRASKSEHGCAEVDAKL